MPYAQYTQAQLNAEISQALEDPANVYWVVPEVNAAINEALLYWGQITSFWSSRGVFNTALSTPFYDLSTKFPALRSRAYTFDQIVKEIQYHLLEAANGVSGSGMTAQFSIGQITSAVIRKRNEFALDTRLPLTFNSFNLTTPPQAGLMQLDQRIELIARASWKSIPTGITTPLRRQDEYGSDALNYQWAQDNGIPYAYSTALTQPIELQLIPPPLAAGIVNLLYIASMSPSVAAGTTFNIPDEFYMALKYGAMHSLFSTDNEGYDPFRAKYCLERYKQCVQQAADMRSLLRITINGNRCPLDTIWNLDATRPFWQTQTGPPDFCGYLYDIVALAPLANSTAYSITCDLVRSAPLPVNPGDPIQIGREEIPYIFDYCRHILSFKLGGAEFAATFPLFDNFMAGAAQRGKLQNVNAKYMTPMVDTGKREQDVQPAA